MTLSSNATISNPLIISLVFNSKYVGQDDLPQASLVGKTWKKAQDLLLSNAALDAPANKALSPSERAEYMRFKYKKSEEEAKRYLFLLKHDFPRGC